MPYALAAITLDGERCVAAAPEDHGPLFLVRPPFDRSVEIAPGPGGCMGIAARPDRTGEIYAIMGCFLGYKFQGGGIYAATRPADGGDAWSMERILDLPFAHRIDFVTKGGTLYLVTASIAADKADPADWSKPGSLYVAAVPRSPDDRWQLAPVLEGIHKHHGFRTGTYGGRPAILVSGVEGLFAVWLDEQGSGWPSVRLIDREISEFSLYDIDGDGREELVTIEPFHGNRLKIYRSAGDGWGDAVWEAELEYGHCLWTGSIAGRRSVLVSNRSGTKNLDLYRIPEGLPGRNGGAPNGAPAGRSSGTSLSLERIVVDEGAGAANMVVVPARDGDLIFSANQAAGEIVTYEVT